MLNFIREKAFDYYKQIEIKQHRLTYLFLELSRNCNLNCLHCGSDCKKNINFPELTTQSWLRIIDFIAANFSNKVNLIITGGEPLLYRELVQIAKHIHSHGFRWGIVSNGHLLNETIFNSLILNGLTSCTISIDGTKKEHNFLRNNNHSFEKVCNALKIVGKSDLKYKDAVSCIFPKNLGVLNEIAEILIENGITSWRLFRIFPLGRAAKNTDLQLSQNQNFELLQWIAENRNRLKNRNLDLNLSCEGWLPFAMDKKVRSQPFFCRAGINFASILADGSITGCSNNHSDFAQGNILNDNFAFVWKNKFKEFRKRDWLKTTNCVKCSYFDKCKGGSIHLWTLTDKNPKFCYFPSHQKKIN